MKAETGSSSSRTLYGYVPHRLKTCGFHIFNAGKERIMDKKIKQILDKGLVIPASPLALTAEKMLN